MSWDFLHVLLSKPHFHVFKLYRLSLCHIHGKCGGGGVGGGYGTPREKHTLLAFTCMQMKI